MNRRKRSLSHWYPRYVADYHKKTRGLSQGQHGAYVLFMDYIYATGEPIPVDMDEVYRIAVAHGRSERESAVFVLKKFFILMADGWHNERADEELGIRKNISEVRRQAQAEKERKRLARLGANAPANDGAKMDTSTSTEGISKDIPPPISPVETEIYFAQLWAVYPGRGKYGATGAGFKGSRKKAFEKFHTLLKKETDHDRFTTSLCAGAQRYDEFIAATDTPSKHLITWLNGACWKDDYSSTPGRGPGGPGGGRAHAEVVAEGFLGALRDDGGEEH